MPDDLTAEIQAADDAVVAAAKVLAAWQALPPDVQASLPVSFQEAIAVMANAINEVRST